jgi:hypothetical protein
VLTLTTDCPHPGQNLASSGSTFPQDGHVIANQDNPVGVLTPHPPPRRHRSELVDRSRGRIDVDERHIERADRRSVSKKNLTSSPITFFITETLSSLHQGVA